jgi:hypothetical protein
MGFHVKKPQTARPRRLGRISAHEALHHRLSLIGERSIQPPTAQVAHLAAVTARPFAGRLSSSERNGASVWSNRFLQL